jgi:hypothetical protein
LGVKFLGTPIEQFERLCREEEKVTVVVSCFKSDKEGLYHPDGTVTHEDILVAQWGRRITSAKDIFTYDDEEVQGMKDLNDDTKEKLR